VQLIAVVAVAYIHVEALKTILAAISAVVDTKPCDLNLSPKVDHPPGG
jgi:hypothetical protein